MYGDRAIPLKRKSPHDVDHVVNVETVARTLVIAYPRDGPVEAIPEPIDGEGDSDQQQCSRVKTCSPECPARHDHGGEPQQGEMVGVDPEWKPLRDPDQRLLLDPSEYAVVLSDVPSFLRRIHIDTPPTASCRAVSIEECVGREEKGSRVAHGPDPYRVVAIMIELRSLTKRYGDVSVVDGLSLSVAGGELLVLLGGSGSGKTTTLKMINRLIEPTSGSVLIDGTETSAVVPHELRRRIGYAFQQVGLFPHMTVEENIAVTPSLLGWEPDRVRARVDELLTLVELDPTVLRTRRPDELSGGQQQRVGVARALAAGPSILLLDEPFGALDPLTRRRLQESFTRIQRELSLTTVFVTHDMVEALMLGDRIAVLNEGRLIQVGTPRELMTQPADNYVRELMSTPRRQAEVVDKLMTADATHG
jgi:osmoprotectant transport system ATP-binding protein